MRLLVLSNTPFLPATAGNRERIRQMLEFLGARGVELGMLLLPAGDRPTWDVAGMVACLVLAVGGLGIGAWGMSRRDVGT